MDALHGDGLDEHCVDAELVLKVSPGDEFRVNGSVDDRLMGEDASPQHCFSFVAFFFFGERQGIVTAQ